MTSSKFANYVVINHTYNSCNIFVMDRLFNKKTSYKIEFYLWNNCSTIKNVLQNRILSLKQLFNKKTSNKINYINNGSTLQQKNVLQNRILSMKQLFNNKKRPTRKIIFIIRWLFNKIYNKNKQYSTLVDSTTN